MKILVIEDERDFIELIEDRKRDYVIIAVNAVDALSILLTEQVDMVFCDFHGIQKAGKSAHDVIQHCIAANIPAKITSSDLRTASEFHDRYGVDSVSKIEMIVAL